MEEPLLLIPGPTNLSTRVREVMGRHQISHVSPEFYESFKELLVLSKDIFRNEKGFQFVFSGSGTSGMEASVVNTVHPGERSLVVVNGYFGERMKLLNEIHRAKVDVLQYKEGEAARPDDLRKKLTGQKYRAVFITHVETATSVINPIKELVDECRKAGVFSIVDSVCGVGGEEMEFDRLGADIVFTASQKGLAAPPGAVLIAASKEIMEFYSKRTDPIQSYYLDLNRWKTVMDDPKIYLTTPSIQVLLALREALMEVREEGLEHRWERHKKLGALARSRLAAMGLQLVAKEGDASDTVSACWVKEGTPASIVSELTKRHNVLIARGVSYDKDKMIRLGHFGNLTPQRLDASLGYLEEVVDDLGVGKKRSIQVAKHR